MMYNGVYLEELIPNYITLNVEGRESIDIDIFSEDHNYIDGGNYYGKRFPSRVLTITFAIDTGEEGWEITDAANAKIAQVSNKLKRVLSADQAKIIFNDELDKYYIGTRTGAIDVSISNGAMTGSFEILCADPFKYSVEEKEVDMSVVDTDIGPVYGFEVELDAAYSAYPRFVVDFQTKYEEDGSISTDTDCGYILISKSDTSYSIQFGDDEAKNEPPKGDAVVINRDFKNATWEELQLEGWTIDNTLSPTDFINYTGANSSVEASFYGSTKMVASRGITLTGTETTYHGVGSEDKTEFLQGPALVYDLSTRPITGNFSLQWSQIFARSEADTDKARHDPTSTTERGGFSIGFLASLSGKDPNKLYRIGGPLFSDRANYQIWPSKAIKPSQHGYWYPDELGYYANYDDYMYDWVCAQQIFLEITDMAVPVGCSGVWTTEYVNACKRFQQKHTPALVVTGQWDWKTDEKAAEFTRLVNSKLKAKGFPKLNQETPFSRSWQASYLTNFQKAHGLQTHGRLDSATLAALGISTNNSKAYLSNANDVMDGVPRLQNQKMVGSQKTVAGKGTTKYWYVDDYISIRRFELDMGKPYGAALASAFGYNWDKTASWQLKKLVIFMADSFKKNSDGTFSRLPQMESNFLSSIKLTAGNYNATKSFMGGDHLEINTNTLEVYLNSMPAQSLGDYTNNWDKIILTAGNNKLLCQWSDWIPDEYHPQVKMYYRERYL